MKSKKIAIVLTLTLILGVGGTAFAAGSTTTTNNTTTCQTLGMNRMAGIRGYDSVTSVLKDKLGLTDQAIADGLSSGKTVYDLAKEKGLTEEQFKAALLDERSKAIDEAVTKGAITKVQGDTLKENLKTNQANCTGNFGEGNLNSIKNGTSHGNGGGMLGSGRGMMKNSQ